VALAPYGHTACRAPMHGWEYMNILTERQVSRDTSIKRQSLVQWMSVTGRLHASTVTVRVWYSSP